jgi:hypothetical protein
MDFVLINIPPTAMMVMHSQVFIFYPDHLDLVVPSIPCVDCFPAEFPTGKIRSMCCTLKELAVYMVRGA